MSAQRPDQSPITPPATIGMLGGGQLGRYALMAARTMGFRTMVLEPDPEAPAGAVADEHLIAEYDDPQALARLADRWPGVHVLFQSISPRYVGRESRVPAGKLTRARLRWGLESGRDIESWSDRYRFLGEWAFIDRHRDRWGHLRWLSLLPWIRRDLRTVMKISEVRLDGPEPATGAAR